MVKEQEYDLLKATIAKAKDQVFVLTAENLDEEFSKEILKQVVKEQNLEVQVLHQYEHEDVNYELCLVNLKQNLTSFKIPLGGEARYSLSTILEVDLAKCTDLFGAAYIGDFQQFVAMLQEYGENRDLKYEDSILKKYYENFKPKNQEETLFAKRGRARGLHQGWIGYPWSWYPERRVVFMNDRGETRPGGNHNFGPNSDEFGKGNSED